MKKRIIRKIIGFGRVLFGLIFNIGTQIIMAPIVIISSVFASSEEVELCADELIFETISFWKQVIRKIKKEDI